MANSENLYTIFRKKISDIEKTRRNLNKSFRSRYLNKSDLGLSYSGLYLSLFSEFEALIEDLFLGLLKGDIISNKTGFRIRVQISPNTFVNDVLFVQKKYLNWLPFDDCTEKRAKIFFDNGIPFTGTLDGKDKSDLAFLHIIRNSIAHRSKSSKDSFLSKISSLALLPEEQNPAMFLLNIPNPANSKYNTPQKLDSTLRCVII